MLRSHATSTSLGFPLHFQALWALASLLLSYRETDDAYPVSEKSPAREEDP